MSISEDKIADLRVKHLEMLQSVVTRMAGQCATLKNYCVTISVAVSGFAITLQRPLLALLSMLPILIFALLDAQYLRLERRFRAQFDRVRKEGWGEAPSFEISDPTIPAPSYWAALFSWSILSFYTPLAALIAIVVMIARQVYGRLV